jgi:hypothetical protein
MTATGKKLFQSVSRHFSLVLFSDLSVVIARTIINKQNRAIKNKLESQDYFEELSAVPTPQQLALWEREISVAEAKRTNRPEAMDIMAPRIPKGQFIPYLYFSDSPLHSANIG